MNLIQEIGKLIESFNQQNKCGLCWVYKPGGRSDYFNNIKLLPGEECCVYVAVMDISANGGYTSNQYGVTRNYTDWRFKMFFGIPSSLDIQFYNENEAYPVGEGKWERYINPLLCCLNDGADFDLCGMVNCEGGAQTVEIHQWVSKVVMNYRDYNMDGVEVTAVFRQFNN